MEDLIHAFGIDGRLIVIQLFNFTLLAGILWYILYKPVLNLLDDRRAKIEKGLKDAAEGEAMRTNAEAERKDILRAAEEEALESVARGKEAGKEASEAILKAAEDKAAATVKRAEIESEELKRKIEAESQAEVAKAALLAAEKSCVQNNSGIYMTPSSYATAIQSLLKDGLSFEKIMASLDAVLERHGRMKLKTRILRDLARRLEKKGDEVTVTVAKEEDAIRFKDDIEEALRHMNALSPRTRVDESIVGGFIVKTNTASLDRSYKRELIELYRNIINSHAR